MSHRRIGEVVLCELSISLILTIAMGAVPNAEAAQPDLDRLIGQPADIASRADQYRADRKPEDNPPKEVWLRLRHSKTAPIKNVTVNGKDWNNFNKDKETIELCGRARVGR
ncbi:MAG: hypothetical protein ACYC3X_11430 [Pirellulaceae bacterium]